MDETSRLWSQPPCSARIPVKGGYQKRPSSLLTLQATLLHPTARDPIMAATVSQGQKITEYY